MTLYSPRILFVHHSVGRYILSQGDLRKKLAAQLPSAEMWDHDYNKFGLSDGHGRSLDRAFPVPDDNTDPAGLVALLRGVANGAAFAEEVRSFDVVVMKSCYPNNAIKSDAAESELREIYKELLAVTATMPFHVVLVTSPPLAPERTNKAQRERAVRTAQWLKTTWNGPNASVADIFSVISVDSGPLKGALAWTARRPWPMDSHPSSAGCARAAEVVVDAVVEVIENAVAAEESGDTS